VWRVKALQLPAYAEFGAHKLLNGTRRGFFKVLASADSGVTYHGDAYASSQVGMRILNSYEVAFLARELALAGAAAALVQAARPALDEQAELAQRRADLDASEARMGAALTSERLNLPANLDDGFRRAAAETLAMAQPRTWPLADNRRSAADQEFLLDLLDEVITRASETSKAALLADPPPRQRCPSQPPRTSLRPMRAAC